jgi:fibronectin-binding autotransporter adhesin
MKPKLSLRALILGCALISTSAVFADTLTWDNGAATGNWNTTDLNWSGAATWNNATPDDAVFGATGVGTVTLTGAITAGTITFDTAGYTIDTSTFGLTLNTGITANQAATIQSGVDGSIILGADNDWSVAASTTLTVSSAISGASFGITKSGAGTLSLSGPNTYGGDTTLNGGTVIISNATSFGAGDVLVTANSTINAAALDYANDISIDATRVLSLKTTGAASSTTTFSGAITGDGGITLERGTNTSTIVNLSSTSNTFTGNLTLPAVSGTNDFINFASIGDGGSIVFARASWLANVRYTGAADLTFNTRNIALATTIGIPAGYDGGGNPSHMFANNGAGTVTINTDMGVTSTAASTIFFLGGTNTGDNTFAGAIADPTGTNTLGIGKSDAGKWILSNNTNSFEGPVIVNRGILSVGVIDVAANAQPLGKGSLIRMGYRDADTGTLEYTGSANAVTDKQIQLGQPDRTNNGNFEGGGVILNNGAGTLTFSNDTFATFNSTAGVSTTGTGIDRTLTLGGTNTGANTIEGTIQDNNGAIGAQLLLTKTGDGTWVLTGDNSYTGATAINGGTLVITGATQATTSITFGGGVLGLTTATTVNAASATVDFTGQQVLVTGATGSPSYTLLSASSITGSAPTLAAGSVSGYELQVVGNDLRLVQTGAPTGFAAWQAANSTSGGLDEDHDNDGVDNGTEYFLGGTSDTTGFTALPGVDNTAGTLSVTWTKAASYGGTYGTDFVVETSATLANPWTTETLGVNVAIVGDDVTYTFPAGTKNFARLKVTGP